MARPQDDGSLPHTSCRLLSHLKSHQLCHTNGYTDCLVYCCTCGYGSDTRCYRSTRSSRTGACSAPPSASPMRRPDTDASPLHPRYITVTSPSRHRYVIVTSASHHGHITVTLRSHTVTLRSHYGYISRAQGAQARALGVPRGVLVLAVPSPSAAKVGNPEPTAHHARIESVRSICETGPPWTITPLRRDTVTP